MVSAEDSIILKYAVLAVLAFSAVALFELWVGFPGQWAYVVAFLVVLCFGAIFPQLALLRADRSVPRTARFGVITLVLVVMLGIFGNSVAGIERTAILLIAAGTVAAIIAMEASAGYNDSTGS